MRCLASPPPSQIQLGLSYLSVPVQICLYYHFSQFLQKIYEELKFDIWYILINHDNSVIRFEFNLMIFFIRTESEFLAYCINWCIWLKQSMTSDSTSIIKYCMFTRSRPSLYPFQSYKHGQESWTARGWRLPRLTGRRWVGSSRTWAQRRRGNRFRPRWQWE